MSNGKRLVISSSVREDADTMFKINEYNDINGLFNEVQSDGGKRSETTIMLGACEFYMMLNCRPLCASIGIAAVGYDENGAVIHSS